MASDCFFQRSLVNLVAVHAADMIRGMWSADPVAGFLSAGMATEARAIGFFRGALAEGDDFGDLATTVHVQASGSVAIFAFHALLGMEGVVEILGHCVMTIRAIFGTDPLCARDFDIFGERRNGVLGMIAGSLRGNSSNDHQAS